jgi:hypothetical protein
VGVLKKNIPNKLALMGFHPGLFATKAVQISGLVDSVALILLDELQLQPGTAKPGWGSAER